MNAIYRFEDTIYALSSGTLPAGVAVVRVSGPHTGKLVSAMTGQSLVPRRLTLSSLVASDGTVLDEALVVIFPGPASFTGETCAEFHVHGGRAVVAALFNELCRHDGLRPAEPGEFSRRALINGKFTLTEAEALADLIDSRTEEQRRLAVQQLGGGHARLYAGWRERLLLARAMLEAEIDFADEDDVPANASGSIWGDIEELRVQIVNHIAAYKRAEIVRQGFRITIAGAPNAGKSSLLNALARRDAAIVSAEPGTTRDLVEVELDLDGMRVVLTDTAGIRATDGKVEKEGIRRAHDAAARADLVLWLTDATEFWDDVQVDVAADVLRIATKIDLVPTLAYRSADFAISVLSGQGVAELLEECGARAKVSQGDSMVETIPFTARHVAELRAAEEALARALSNGADAIELRIEDLRRAGHALGRLIGAIDIEQILDAIFARFCIGK